MDWALKYRLTGRRIVGEQDLWPLPGSTRWSAGERAATQPSSIADIHNNRTRFGKARRRLPDIKDLSFPYEILTE